MQELIQSIYNLALRYKRFAELQNFENWVELSEHISVYISGSCWSVRLYGCEVDVSTYNSTTLLIPINCDEAMLRDVCTKGEEFINKLKTI